MYWFLGEYDALSGLSQEWGRSEHIPVVGQEYAHGYGHSALGVASLAAALIVKEYLDKYSKAGKIIFYGCCAEEDTGVKPLMAMNGEFQDTDCVFAWHPSYFNGVTNFENIADKGFTVEFKGTTAHAGMAPHLGRSALDACELMNVGVNYLREHVIQEARIHYAYLDVGGSAPNVVQDHTKMYYLVRAPRITQVDEILERVITCAKGAAMMTGTTVETEHKMGYSDVFQNTVIARILSKAAEEIGPPEWDEEDIKLAAEFVAHYDRTQEENRKKQTKVLYASEKMEESFEKVLHDKIVSFDEKTFERRYGCSDVGDVCYVTPTAILNVATMAIGAPAHSWFMTGMTGSSIGEKGILCAAEILSLAALKVYEAPNILKGAQEERIKRVGNVYKCPMVE